MVDSSARPEASDSSAPSTIARFARRVASAGRAAIAFAILSASVYSRSRGTTLCTRPAAKAAGASAVYVSEPAPERGRVASELGADAVINPLEQDLIAEIDALTGGIGPDIVFDCAGFPSTLDQAFNVVRRTGQVVLVAVPWEELPLRPVDWMAREISFKSSWGSLPADWHRALGLMSSGKLTVKPLISEVGYIPLEGMQEAFEGLTKPSNQLQLVVRP